MPDPNDPLQQDEQVTKRVTYEHVSSSGTSRQSAIVIGILVVLAIALIVFIFMHK